MTARAEPDPEDQIRDADASALMKRGIALMQEAEASAAAAALSSFDAALAIRRQLPIERVPAFAYGLAACWLNRAEALTRLGGDERWNAAVEAYDEAIAILRPLPLDADERYRRRLAIACQNRGLTLVTFFEGRAGEAVDAFAEALLLLEHDSTASAGDRASMMGAVLLNLTAAHRARGTVDAAAPAQQAVTRALGLVAPFEPESEPAAEVGLKSRHAICQLVAERLSHAAPGEHQMDDVHLATDAVDSGLDLIRDWELRGVTRFRDLASDLLRFGALVYERYQPQFLDEFLTERLREFGTPQQ